MHRATLSTPKNDADKASSITKECAAAAHVCLKHLLWSQSSSSLHSTAALDDASHLFKWQQLDVWL
jgi:hypothetical protein